MTQVGGAPAQAGSEHQRGGGRGGSTVSAAAPPATAAAAAAAPVVYTAQVSQLPIAWVRGPSAEDGVAQLDIARATRAACRFIKSVCRRLQLRVVATCSAQVFLHRFYSRQSLKHHDPLIVATTCIFLAAKVEENIQNLDVVLDAAHAERSQTAVEALSKNQEALWKMREKVMICERVLLNTLSFDISVEHSHAHALKMVKLVCGGGQQRELQQTTWSILNDSLATNVCLRYHPRRIAASAVVLACLFLKDRADPSSTAKKAVEFMQNLERNGDVFGFKPEDLRPVQDELLATYEAELDGPSSSSSVVFVGAPEDRGLGSSGASPKRAKVTA